MVHHEPPKRAMTQIFFEGIEQLQRSFEAELSR
jgi:hypothetical protein